MDHVEQLHGFGRLVGLELTDLVEPDVGIAREQGWPLAERFLDAVLAKVALASVDQRLDFLGGAALADGDELNVGRIALRNLGSPGNLIEDGLAAAQLRT